MFTYAMEDAKAPPPASLRAGPAVLAVLPRCDYHASLRGELENIDLEIVRTAREALALHNAHPFDGYLLGFWLEDWTGNGLCREIRRTELNAPILFLTAAEGTLPKQRALRAGADGFFYDDDGVASLVAELRRCMRRADERNLRARYGAEAAVVEEVRRRNQAVRQGRSSADILEADAVERVARSRAKEAFVAAGGTLASFDRYWNVIFSTGVASARAGDT